jgi:hypothetical protein
MSEQTDSLINNVIKDIVDASAQPSSNNDHNDQHPPPPPNSLPQDSPLYATLAAEPAATDNNSDYDSDDSDAAPPPPPLPDEHIQYLNSLNNDANNNNNDSIDINDVSSPLSPSTPMEEPASPSAAFSESPMSAVADDALGGRSRNMTLANASTSKPSSRGILLTKPNINAGKYATYASPVRLHTTTPTSTTALNIGQNKAPMSQTLLRAKTINTAAGNKTLPSSTSFPALSIPLNSSANPYKIQYEQQLNVSLMSKYGKTAGKAQTTPNAVVNAPHRPAEIVMPTFPTLPPNCLRIFESPYSNRSLCLITFCAAHNVAVQRQTIHSISGIQSNTNLPIHELPALEDQNNVEIAGLIACLKYINEKFINSRSNNQYNYYSSQNLVERCQVDSYLDYLQRLHLDLDELNYAKTLNPAAIQPFHYQNSANIQYSLATGNYNQNNTINIENPATLHHYQQLLKRMQHLESKLEKNNKSPINPSASSSENNDSPTINSYLLGNSTPNLADIYGLFVFLNFTLIKQLFEFNSTTFPFIQAWLDKTAKYLHATAETNNNSANSIYNLCSIYGIKQNSSLLNARHDLVALKPPAGNQQQGNSSSANSSTSNPESREEKLSRQLNEPAADEATFLCSKLLDQYESSNRDYQLLRQSRAGNIRILQPNNFDTANSTRISIISTAIVDSSADLIFNYLASHDVFKEENLNSDAKQIDFSTGTTINNTNNSNFSSKQAKLIHLLLELRDSTVENVKRTARFDFFCNQYQRKIIDGTYLLAYTSTPVLNTVNTVMAAASTSKGAIRANIELAGWIVIPQAINSSHSIHTINTRNSYQNKEYSMPAHKNNARSRVVFVLNLQFPARVSGWVFSGMKLKGWNYLRRMQSIWNTELKRRRRKAAEAEAEKEEEGQMI